MAEDPDRLRAIAARHATVADKIRALSAAGVPRADIARFLGKRYQHVRNVLEGDAQSSGGQGRREGADDPAPGASSNYVLGRADLSGLREGPRPFDRDDDESRIEGSGKDAFWLEVRPDGSLPLPPEIARLLQAEAGRKVFARIKDGQLVVMSGEAALAQ